MTITRGLTSLLLLISYQFVQADEQSDWEAGVAAFESGCYAAALESFERARASGFEGPAVLYNIGVSEYRLGRFADAGRTFESLGRAYPKMRGLANYNQGLVASQLGQTASARAHFLQAYEQSPDNKTIRVLASRRLRALEPERMTASRWSGAVGIQAGYDDNIVLRDDTGLPLGTTTESPMAEFFGAVSGPWSWQNGFRVDAGFYHVRYADADEFDQTEIQVGAAYEWLPGEWRIQVGAHGAYGTLGGDPYDSRVGANARITRRLTRNMTVGVRYAHDDISEGDALFAGVEGTRQQLDARLRWYHDDHDIVLRYRAETNERLDPGISPDRNRYAVQYRYRPDSGLGGELSFNQRQSEYHGAALPRTEDLTYLAAALTYAFGDGLLVRLQFSQAENDSTDPTYSYDRNQVSLGAVKFF